MTQSQSQWGGPKREIATRPNPRGAKKYLASMKLRFVISRHALASLGSAGVDYLLFMPIYWLGHNIFIATYIARTVSLLVNFTVMKKLVYYSDQRFIASFPKYLGLVVLSGFLSSVMVTAFAPILWGKVFLAKVLSDSLLYVFNFFVLRWIIFQKK